MGWQRSLYSHSVLLSDQSFGLNEAIVPKRFRPEGSRQCMRLHVMVSYNIYAGLQFAQRSSGRHMI